MATGNPDWVVRWPTLGFLVADWIAQHCIVPDGFRKGEPFEMYDWQLWCTANHYRVKPNARFGQLSPAFYYRRSQVIAPQKTGKGPWAATIVIAEALGPVVFAGWAQSGDAYVCADNGCDCGWTYAYGTGEPMGRPWPTPLIQLLATSEDQVANVYRPLKAMAKTWPLSLQMVVGEEFTRLPGDGLIEVVTSSAMSRLGNPIIFALQDETGIYTTTNKLVSVAQTQRRGAAGMGGRSIETSNSWDPSAQSTAQRTAEAALKVTDIFRFHELAPAHLSYTNKRERRRIHQHVYRGSAHVDLDAIESEAAELLLEDPGQAERFFGNRVVSGHSSWLELAAWEAREDVREVSAKTRVVLGFDGSDVDDWTGIRAETLDGYQFTPTYGPDRKPTVWDPADYGGQVPRLEVAAAMDELMTTYDVVRAYADPPYWESEIDNWVDQYGEKVVIRWYTRRIVQMDAAADRLVTDVNKAEATFAHDACPWAAAHVANARKAARPGGRYVLAKASDAQKIDVAICSILAHEAACDSVAAGLARPKRQRYAYTSSS
jgi:hypothetical protein